MGGYDSTRERGPRWKYSWDIDPTHIHKIIIIVYNLLFVFECSQSQSLNSCKRVGVRSYIPLLLGAWG
jgi:hypothetical protein